MLFYLLTADEFYALLDRLGYPARPATIPRTVDYYLDRTSHGSTLSKLVHAWVLARSDRRRAWRYFLEALESDVADVQGGTTAEGIHLGAMAGTLDLLQRGFTGLETRGDALGLDPCLPDALTALCFRLRYRGHPGARGGRHPRLGHGRRGDVAPGGTLPSGSASTRCPRPARASRCRSTGAGRLIGARRPSAGDLRPRGLARRGPRPGRLAPIRRARSSVMTTRGPRPHPSTSRTYRRRGDRRRRLDAWGSPRSPSLRVADADRAGRQGRQPGRAAQRGFPGAGRIRRAGRGPARSALAAGASAGGRGGCTTPHSTRPPPGRDEHARRAARDGLPGRARRSAGSAAAPAVADATVAGSSPRLGRRRPRRRARPRRWARTAPRPPSPGMNASFTNVRGRRRGRHARSPSAGPRPSRRGRSPTGRTTARAGSPTIAVVVQVMVPAAQRRRRVHRRPGHRPARPHRRRGRLGPGRGRGQRPGRARHLLLDGTGRLLEVHRGTQTTQDRGRARRRRPHAAVDPGRGGHRCSTPPQAEEIARLALRVQEHYGAPQDVEWAIDRRAVCLVQTRPITTLGAAAPTPARPRAGDAGHWCTGSPPRRAGRRGRVRVLRSPAEGGAAAGRRGAGRPADQPRLDARRAPRGRAGHRQRRDHLPRRDRRPRAGRARRRRHPRLRTTDAGRRRRGHRRRQHAGGCVAGRPRRAGAGHRAAAPPASRRRRRGDRHRPVRQPRRSRRRPPRSPRCRSTASGCCAPSCCSPRRCRAATRAS